MGKQITESTVFVVSGGAKGITAQCVTAVAQRYGCKFILMGRSRLNDTDPAWANGIEDEAALKQACMKDMQARGEKPLPKTVNKAVNGVLSQREIRETLANIAQVGGQAVYVSADITDLDAIKSGIASSNLGPVTGIIHGAGNLADKLIEKKTVDDFDWVYTAKVKGLENLLAAVPTDQIDFLVLFSSVAGFYGNVGQADYAIANEILNKTAHRFQQMRPDAKVVSINWGPWDGGMVTPQLRAYFDELNIKIIPVEVGTQMLVDELSADTVSDVQIVVGSAITAPPTPPQGELKTHHITRTLSLEASPFLGDHVVDGKAVLPMVSAMSWMASTAEQLYRGYHYFGFDNYKVLKGIVFDETLAPEYTLELKEASTSEDEIILDAMIRSTNDKGKPRFHYSAQLTLVKKLPPPPTFTPEIDPDAKEIHRKGEEYYQDGTLFHRDSFKGVQEVLRIGPKGLTMRCELSPVALEYQGQFPIQAFNYFMADVGLQAIGIWARYSFDAGSLPLRAMHGEHFLNFDFGETFFVNMKVLSTTDTDVVAEISLYDEQNRLYFVVTDIAVTMNKRLNEMFLRNTIESNA